MNIKHTPGPWVADLSKSEDGTPYAEIHPEGESGWVNGRYLRVGGAIDEHDARLIAASPDLLKSALAARDVLATAIRANWEGATDNDIAEHVTIKRLDAAIAKATGA